MVSSVCYSEYRTELLRFHKKINECPSYYAGNIIQSYFLWGFSRDTEFNIKQTKSPFSFPSSNIFVTKVMTAQYGFSEFHCAFVPLFFHT